MARTGLITATTLACAIGVGLPGRCHAQPEPSFSAACGELREALADLSPADDAFLTIQVEGPLTTVQTDGALVYMGLCSPPDPQVLCVTYSAGGWEVGDPVTVTGTYGRPGPDHIQLDPCLPSPADEAVE